MPEPRVTDPRASRGAHRFATALTVLALAACAAPAPTTTPAAVPAPGPERSYAAYPGFDAYYYPGDSALRAWRTPASPYRWIGYYLPAPCHRETSWAGRRPTITDLGWGIAVLYVGQQTWEGQPAPPRPDSAAADTLRLDSLGVAAPPPPPACAPSQLTAERGMRDAADAVARAAAEGFAPGTVLYLDLERMETIPPAMHDYYRAWLRGVVADARYRPGIYCHAHNAAELYGTVRAELAAAGATAEPRFWIASATGFDVTKRPTDVGHAFAEVWQGAFDVTETWGGVTLRVDVNVSRSPSPSMP